MKACTLTFAMQTGTGTQTVSGIVDVDGATFAGKAFMFHGPGTLDTVMAGNGAFRDAYMIAHGFDDGAGTRLGEASADAAGFGYKVVDGGTSGVFSLITIHAQLSFGGYIPLEAYVSAVADGSFTLTYVLNDTSSSSVYPFFVSGQSIMVTVLGGDDLSVSVGTPTGGGNPTTIGFQAEGLLFKKQSISLGTSTGTGGGGTANWGWATRTSGQGLSSTYVILQAGNERYQATDRCWGGATGAGTIATAGAVTNWGATSFTVNTAIGQTAYLAAGGATIVASAGTLTQPTSSTGVQVVSTGIAPKVVFVQSVGAAASASLATDQAEWCFGSMDGTRGSSVWCAETGNNPSSPLGARYVSHANVLQFGTPNAASTTFAAQAQFVSFDAVAGTFTLHWSAIDSTARQILWFALGEAMAPAPPAPTANTNRDIRVLRRFPLPTMENRQLFLSRLEFVIQSGVGLSTGQGSDPQLMLRISRDGGHTFGNELWLSMGKMGEYQRRAFANRLGRGRNLVVEVVCSDPVFVAFLQCSADLQMGTS